MGSEFSFIAASEDDMVPREEQPEKKVKRKPGRPKKNEKAVEDPAYKQAYDAYVRQCQAVNEELAAAKANLAQAVSQRKELMDQWNVYIAKLRLQVADLKAKPKPVPPVKQR